MAYEKLAVDQPTAMWQGPRPDMFRSFVVILSNAEELAAFLEWSRKSIASPSIDDRVDFFRVWHLAMSVPYVYRDAIQILYWQVGRTRAVSYLYKEWGHCSLRDAIRMVDALIAVTVPQPRATVEVGGVR